MIIYRIGTKGNWEYIDSKKKQITDMEIMEYITKLTIPPGYTDVKIFYNKRGQPKILFQGYDSKGRLQRIYSGKWKKTADMKKFCDLRNLAEQIPYISAKVKHDMESSRLTKNKCIALIIRIVMVCYFRIGNKKYQELYGSFGAMNIRGKHIFFKKDSEGKEYMYISFNGKKGVLNTCSIYDRALIKEIREILKRREPDEPLFKTNENGSDTPIRAIDVNNWLKSFNKNITSKDFRTYDANILLIIHLRSFGKKIDTKMTARKKIITSVLKSISELMHNTPTVLRANYTQSGIITLYVNQPRRFARYFLNEKPPRTVLLEYLRDYCKKYDE